MKKKELYCTCVRELPLPRPLRRGEIDKFLRRSLALGNRETATLSPGQSDKHAMPPQKKSRAAIRQFSRQIFLHNSNTQRARTWAQRLPNVAACMNRHWRLAARDRVLLSLRISLFSFSRRLTWEREREREKARNLRQSKSPLLEWISHAHA